MAKIKKLFGAAFYSVAAAFAGSISAAHASEKILHSFSGQADGGNPTAGLVEYAGFLYGVTQQGGNGNGQGTIFRMAPGTGAEKVLHNFQGPDGSTPSADLIVDAQGALYGTTINGGEGNKGTVFRLTTDGVLKTLYSFPANGIHGASPEGRLAQDASGNLYGTTSGGGKASCLCGVVFKLAPDGTETVLHAFTGNQDGGSPATSSLILDAQGNLYGTNTTGGEASGNGGGVAFKMSPTGKETVLHGFGQIAGDGREPNGGVVMDKDGNLFGATSFNGGLGFGTIYKIAPNGAESTIYSFAGGSRGGNPSSGLAMRSSGDLYGVTTGGGKAPCNCGVVYKVTLGGQEFVLHSFSGGSDGAFSVGDLAIDAKGHLYGTTAQGSSSGNGTVFKVN